MEKAIETRKKANDFSRVPAGNSRKRHGILVSWHLVKSWLSSAKRLESLISVDLEINMFMEMSKKMPILFTKYFPL